MALTDEDKKRFDVVRSAIANGDLCIVETTRKSDGKRAVCMAVIQETEGGGALMFPVAELFERSTQFDDYNDPQDDASKPSTIAVH